MRNLQVNLKGWRLLTPAGAEGYLVIFRRTVICEPNNPEQ